MVLTTQVFAVPDVSTARAALADHLEDAGDALIAHEEQGAQRWLQSTVTFDEESLTVSTSSAPRAAWFADLIAEVVPDAELVDVERLPVGDLAIGAGIDPGGGADVPIELDVLDPEIGRGLRES